MTVAEGHDEQAGQGPRRWRAEIAAIVDSLSAHLDQTVELVNLTEMEDAFSCLLRGPAVPTSGFQLTWKGVLGMEIIDGRPDVALSMFLFSRGERIRLATHRGSYVELLYEGPLDGTGTWRDLGWTEDPFGEFDAHDEWRPA
ncbi:hypothetical protein ACLQ26_15280 [Micromonospora sp. DT43]|uniref:hypothetical protein n=1 Tax=Micromonospora sp. DT43 TaxID=3393440 RepID=UPI003CF8E1F9